MIFTPQKIENNVLIKIKMYTLHPECLFYLTSEHFVLIHPMASQKWDTPHHQNLRSCLC
jgi:hypothetical protein